MKKQILLLPVSLLVMTIFFSCKKEKSEEKITTNPEMILKVNGWLDSQKPANKATQSANIDLLKTNLDFSGLRIEESTGAEKIIIVPIKKGLAEIKNIDRKAIPSLVLIQDNMGNIRKGNIVLYIPANGETFDRLPDNTFYNILNTGKPEANGKFRYMSVTGRQLNELQYDDGHLKSFGSIKDSSDNSRAGKANTNCVDWYWVTTYYNLDGEIINQTWDYIGTTCQGEDCEDPYLAMVCPMDGSSGGGTGVAEGYEYAVSKPFKWQIEATDNWIATSYETIAGIKKLGEQPCGGHFTSIVHESSYLELGQGYTWTQLGNTVSVDNPCQCTAYTTGKVTQNSNGQWANYSHSMKAFFELQF